MIFGEMFYFTLTNDIFSDTRQQPCNTQCCVKWHTCDRSLASEGTNCVGDADFDEVYLPGSNLKEMIYKKSQFKIKFEC